MRSRKRSVFIHTAAAALLVWTIFPIVWVGIVSVTYHAEFAQSHISLLPSHPTLSNYIRMLGSPAAGLDGRELSPIGNGPLILDGIVNSVIVAVLTTVIGMLVAVPAAYALARVAMRFRSSSLLTIIATRSVPPISTAVPFFALYNALNLTGTRAGLVIVHLTIVVPLTVWVGYSFFLNLPPSLEQMARVDGCSRWSAFRRIVLPAARPGLMAMAVIAFLTSWDEFAFALIFTTGTPTQTFGPALSGMFFLVSLPNEVAAGLVLGLLPPMVLAIVFSRYIRRVNFVSV
ncbi:carbohydrate ABC transporter permease [Planosporangium flavigriseum]|uniref:Binding-protein-dependent transport systems inner membrane component n=1 Tax=Planosporangium flavigriseum TaxID=373681 RepID=A0A8J3PML4_9ACTN|nr:carbohydrate ABC transporter permease [Planosporangium flavigriseum]NJC65545.1 carbohydrate ABC transporter permease [Planosporangium flavigriseum]GIG75017.1 binding-protein-dependent transport systems inner membrane component [Planosporangium flavigriseum]